MKNKKTARLVDSPPSPFSPGTYPVDVHEFFGQQHLKQRSLGLTDCIQHEIDLVGGWMG